MITLRNMSRGMRTYNVPELGSDPHNVVSSVRDRQTGLRSVVHAERHLARSLTILAGEHTHPLPDAVEFSPEIASALTRRELKLTRMPEPREDTPDPDVTPIPIHVEHEDN